MSTELPNQRGRALLKSLVEIYIRDGQPVGSRTLSRESGLQLSPASVRNVMSDLEELGFIESPHTSAGRVPTSKGYRLFVDALIQVRPPNAREVRQMRRLLDGHADNAQELVATASTLLSGVTRLAGVVTVPQAAHAELRHIEFLRLSGARALAILVFNESEVQNRILELDRDYSDAELRRAANYLNERFAGRAISEVKRSLVGQIEKTREHVNQMMLHAISVAQRALDDPPEALGYVLAGQTNLMNFQELGDLESLKRLFEAFAEQRDILHLLDRCLHADGVQIFIGQESGHQILSECSVVTAPYTVDDEVVGVLGVIGPMRMAYEQIIPIVDVTARLLGASLKSGSAPQDPV